MALSLSGRELKLLGGLAAAGGVLLWYYAAREGPPLQGARPAEAGAARAETLGDAPVVRLELLAREGPGFDANGRDLFKYAQRPPSAEEIRRARELEEQRRREAEEAAKRAALEAAERQRQEMEQARLRASEPPPPPAPPAIQLKFIAVIGPPKDKIAVFETGQDLLLAKKGETVQGEFKVVDIKYESVVMGFTRRDFKNQTRELPMTRGEVRR